MDNVRAERGQTMAEYGVVLALITLGIVLAVAALSGSIVGIFDRATGIIS